MHGTGDRFPGGAVGGPWNTGNPGDPDGGRTTQAQDPDLIQEACSNARLLVTFCDLMDGLKHDQQHLADPDPDTQPYFWEL